MNELPAPLEAGLASALLLAALALPPAGPASAVSTGPCYSSSPLVTGEPLEYPSSLAVRPTDGVLFVADDDWSYEVYAFVTGDGALTKVIDHTTPCFEHAAGDLQCYPEGASEAAASVGFFPQPQTQNPRSSPLAASDLGRLTYAD